MFPRMRNTLDLDHESSKVFSTLQQLRHWGDSGHFYWNLAVLVFDLALARLPNNLDSLGEI